MSAVQGQEMLRGDTVILWSPPSPAAVPIFSPGDLVPETCVDWGRKASEDQIMGME